MMDRRTFLMGAAALGGALRVGKGVRAAAESETQHVVLSKHGCGRATGYAEANKIVTVGTKTHVAWLDSVAEGFRVRVRTLDRATGVWSPTYTVGRAADNHGGPALTVDSKGFLHVAYYPHHHPMRYRRSIRPNDASEWTEEVRVGKRCTYPTLVCDRDDTLYLTCRESAADALWVANLYVKRPDAPWQGPRALLQAESRGYAHFMEALAWGSRGDTLHLACRIYDGQPRRGHTIGYLRTKNRGVTWTHWDGSPVALPATAQTVDIVSQKREGPGVGLRAGALAVGPDDKPYVLCSSYDESPMEAWLAYPDDTGAWNQRPLRPELPDGFADWGLATPGGITFSEDGRLFVVLTLIKPPDLVDSTVWGHASSEIAAFVSSDNGGSFASRVITQPDPTVARWLPSLERPTGHNRVAGAPGFMYTEGSPGADNEELLSNTVYWVNPGSGFRTNPLNGRLIL